MYIHTEHNRLYDITVLKGLNMSCFKLTPGFGVWWHFPCHLLEQTITCSRFGEGVVMVTTRGTDEHRDALACWSPILTENIKGTRAHISHLFYTGEYPSAQLHTHWQWDTPTQDTPILPPTTDTPKYVSSPDLTPPPVNSVPFQYHRTHCWCCSARAWRE